MRQPFQRLVSHPNSLREVFVGIGHLWGTRVPLPAKPLIIGSLTSLSGHLIPFVLVVYLLSHVQLSATPRTTAFQASLSFSISQSLLKFMSIESVMPSNHLIFCCLPPSSPSCPQNFPNIRVFCNGLALHIRWPKSFFGISASNKYSGFISFGIYWFDLLAVQETLKSLLQHHSSEAVILWCSALLMVQLSHLYITTGKIIALTIWTCVRKVMSLTF